MLEYVRIDISKGIDISKTNASKECDICHYWYFLDKNFKYEPYVYNGCHHLMQKARIMTTIVNIGLLPLLKGMIIEFIFDILAKMMR